MADNTIQNFLINQSPATMTLKKTLDAQAARQRAHASNIANAETPGYQRVAVEFEDQLKEVLDQNNSASMRRDDPRHMNTNGTGSLEDLSYQTVREPLPEDGSGLNGVDIEREMTEMAETQIRYLASLELLKRRYTGLKSAIKGQ